MELKRRERKDRIFIKGRQTHKNSGIFRAVGSFHPVLLPQWDAQGIPVGLEYPGRRTGKRKSRQVRVNDPFTYKGITFYQSSWDQFPTAIKLSLKKGGQESELVDRDG